MTDRDLLEQAGKAAGIAICWKEWLGTKEWCTHTNTGDFCPWRPLTDDGDALRLATRICADIFINQVTVLVKVGDVAVAQEISKRDKPAATRRAIVRAAAEIGRAME